MKKKLLAVLLTLCMIVSVMPMCLVAFAADQDDYYMVGESDSGYSTDPTPITTRITVESAFITRLDLPKYASDLYFQLVRGSDNAGLSDPFCQEKNFSVDTGKAASEQELNRTESVSECCYRETVYYGEEATVIPGDTDWEQGALYKVDVTGGDKSVNCSTLNPGDLVKTSSFNGIYVTSVVKTGNDKYDAELNETKDNILAAGHAFDRDHPEVFWLSGVTKLKILTTTVTRGGKQVQASFFFYVLADSKGFSALRPEYAENGAIQAGIKERDEAIQTILATVPKTGTKEKIQALNTWLTQHNEYNTTPDLNSLGLDPHRCLSALKGSIGTNGPVCEGYAKAFKVLCDQLQIPCILEDGYAKATPNGAMGLHMWNSVEMPDKNWYAVDITWDDPVIAGKSGAVSGRENEDYLLLGYSSVVNGMRFDSSHQMSNQMANGVTFGAGPYLSCLSYAGEEEPSELPFTDVAVDDYYYDAVKWAYENKITSGVSKTAFGSDSTCTRGQVVTFLWHAMGNPRPTTTKNPFTDVAPSDYFYSAVLWAVENDITSGTSDTTFSPNMTCSQAHIVTFLWRTLGRVGAKGSTPWYVDAVNWAEANDLLAGTGKEFVPNNDCPRADVVTYLYRALVQ